jgi:Kef-type K+ transport system membrane component KefB
MGALIAGIGVSDLSVQYRRHRKGHQYPGIFLLRFFFVALGMQIPEPTLAIVSNGHRPCRFLYWQAA